MAASKQGKAKQASKQAYTHASVQGACSGSP